MTGRVAVLTTFFETMSGYSLVAVVETQLRMLLNNGYAPTVIVQNGAYREDEHGEPLEPEPFQEQELPSIWNSQTLDIRPVLPSLQLTTGVAEDFEERVTSIQSALQKSLTDTEVCITHDIILQDSYKEHNVAMRRYAKTRPDLLWLHWIHSCPTSQAGTTYPENCRYTPPPGYIIYPNDVDKPRVVGTYGLQEREWKVRVSRTAHAIDPLLIWPYDKLTRRLVERAGLLGGDVVAIYPVRLDRGKQPEKIIRLLAGVKKAGFKPRLLIVDWQSHGARFQQYIDELVVLANELDMGEEVNFTSRLDDKCSQGVPRQVVIELLDFTNIYVHPSRIETYSLTVHEAMLRGNLVVLNHDLPVMRELYGQNAVYFDFGSDRVDRTYEPNEQAFWNNEAKRLLAELTQNRALSGKMKASRMWSPQALWKEFEPLLYLTPVSE